MVYSSSFNPFGGPSPSQRERWQDMAKELNGLVRGRADLEEGLWIEPGGYKRPIDTFYYQTTEELGRMTAEHQVVVAREAEQAEAQARLAAERSSRISQEENRRSRRTTWVTSGEPESVTPPQHWYARDQAAMKDGAASRAFRARQAVALRQFKGEVAAALCTPNKAYRAALIDALALAMPGVSDWRTIEGDLNNRYAENLALGSTEPRHKLDAPHWVHERIGLTQAEKAALQHRSDLVDSYRNDPRPPEFPSRVRPRTTMVPTSDPTSDHWNPRS